MSNSRGDERSSSTDPSKRAVKTTIVGGQRQENARAMAPVPVGIEQLLSVAAVSPEFADALYADRRAAIEAAAIELTATEQRILAAVDDASLRRMVANAEGGVPDRHRRAFLSRSAAALLVLAGGAVTSGASACGDDKPVAPTPEPTPVTGSRPDRPEPPPPPPPPPAGIRPDRPEPPLPPDGGPSPAVGGIRPETPMPTRGIRPDRPEIPKPGKGGARPDRPRPTKGIRPDRPIEEPE